MIKYYFVVILLSFVCVSCDKKTAAKDTSLSELDSITVKNKIVNSVGVLLSERARKEVKNWGEYQKIDVLITEFFNTSKSDVLENAADFSKNVQFLRDSIRIAELDNPKIIARLNVLLNESLRLKDMNKIPSISDLEVTNEVKNILRAFSSLNSKINTHYKSKPTEEQLDKEEF